MLRTARTSTSANIGVASLRRKVGTKRICQDPAIRLMVYQLAHLFGVAGAQYDVVHYINDEAACKERLAELGLKPFGAG